MFIEPMKPISSLKDLQSLSQSSNTNSGVATFKDIFQTVIQNAVENERNLATGEYLFATGQIDDTHTVPILAAKAQLSTDLLISLRTKALEAYNELIRLNV